MMKQRFFTLFWTILVGLSMLTSLHAQKASDYYDFSERGEVHFSFKVPEQEILEKLFFLISVDNIDPETNEVKAFASEKEFNTFLKFQIPFEILTAPSLMLQSVEMYDLSKDARYTWNAYPTYESYVSMMHEFQSKYPNLCKTSIIGKSVKNRDLLVCKITSSANEGKKASVFYSSTMHGDETTGYVMMLRLIDYLLSNYETNPRIKAMLDNTEVWINPLANPDGTYRLGNHTVQGATRANANNVDLNRNFKDDVAGDHPDNNTWQAETVAFQNFAAEHNFTIAANLHGGVEVVNYPWDNKYELHADDGWYKHVSRSYADTCHKHSTSNYYMTYQQNGITNGAQWYKVFGGRQDNSNYFHRTREITLEVSNTKLVNANDLPKYWDWNYPSLLNYIEEANYGFQGIVTANGEPVKCEVFIEGHDKKNSSVFSKASTGFYARPIEAGTYTVSFKAEGYPVATRTITVVDKEKLVLDVELVENPVQSPVAEFDADKKEITIGENVKFEDKSTNEPTTWAWIFDGGTPATSSEQNPTITYNQVGEFKVSLKVSNDAGTSFISKDAFIKVLPKAPVADFVGAPLEIYEGETVSFEDKSTNEPTTWAWTFDGGSPASATEQNPTVTYNQEGSYEVTLKASNESGADTMTKTNYVRVKKDTSIDEVNANEKIHLQVLKQTVMIEAQSPIVSVEIFDLTGKVLLQLSPMTEQFSIDLKKLGEGVHMIRVKTADSIKVQKLSIE